MLIFQSYKFLECHFICSIVSIYKTMAHILTLSRGDLLNIVLGFRYRSLHLQDFFFNIHIYEFFVLRSQIFLIDIYFGVMTLFSELNILIFLFLNNLCSFNYPKLFGYTPRHWVQWSFTQGLLMTFGSEA